MKSAIGRGIEQALADLDLSREMPLPTDIPLEPEAFYQDFGFLKHPETRQPVERLSDYQYRTWRLFLEHRKLLEVKTHRAGESSKWMLVSFQLAVLPSSNRLSTRGFDTMLLAPTKAQAVEILRDFRRRALESKKYNPFIMDKPTEVDLDEALSSKAILRDEKSKTAAMYIRNPEDPLRPSRIIALGADRAGSLESLPNFKHLHVSDITATYGGYQDALNVALTRIANTNGSVVIETIPGKPSGQVFDMSRRLRGTSPVKGDFAYVEVTAEDAVAAGVMSREFLDSERKRMTLQEFNAYYMASFDSVTGNTFSTTSIERAIELGKEFEAKYGLSPRPGCERSQGHDPGTYFGSVVIQKIDNKLQVILATESTSRNEDQELYDSAQRVQTWPIETTQVDAAGAGFISSLKRRVGENSRYDLLPKTSYRFMRIKPIAFSTEHKRMLQNLVILMQNEKLAISPKFTELITALRTAVAEDWTLDKDESLHHHVLDALRLACEPYSVGGRK